MNDLPKIYLAEFRVRPDSLIACPVCDALHLIEEVEPGETATCRRCHSVLISAKRNAMHRTIALSLAAVILMAILLFYPFLGMARAGLSKEASIIDIIRSFDNGIFALLSVGMTLFVVAIPVIRALALTYVLLPLLRGLPAPAHAKSIFLFAERLSPWSMTEMFIIGTGVALIKIGGLATVSFGPAFWMFCLLALVVALKNAAICRWTVWSAIAREAA